MKLNIGVQMDQRMDIVKSYDNIDHQMIWIEHEVNKKIGYEL